METIIGAVIGLSIVWWVISLIIGFMQAVTRTAKNAVKTVKGGGSIQKRQGQESHLEPQGMGAFEIRASMDVADGEDAPFDVFRVEGRGIVPTEFSRNIKFVTSILDTTDEKNKPIISTVEGFQEDDSTMFQHVVDGGKFDPNVGYPHWSKLGAVIPEILVPPRGGYRDLMIIFRIIDADQRPMINLGYGEKDDPAVLEIYTEEVRYNFKVNGYEEAAEARDKANYLSVKLAVAVAMADGHFDISEGKVISNWIERAIAGLSGSRYDDVKDACNRALKESYADAQKSILSLSQITSQLNEFGDDTMKYMAIELCLDVMAADGQADASELQMIRRVADALELDYDELQRLKDQRMVGIESKLTGHSDIEEVLGIQPGWSSTKIRQHISSEFRKWNGRINILTDASERTNAQNMLNIIAEARKKYA